MTPDLLNRLVEARQAGTALCLLSRAGEGGQTLATAEEAESHPAPLADAIHAALRTDQLQSCEIDGARWFVTPFNPPVQLFIIGAVHIAQALVPLLHALGFDAQVIDPRGAFARAERFDGVDVVEDWPDDALERAPITHRTAIVTLTHDPKLDDPALSLALRSPAFYIGALGSKRTHAQRVERLTAQGFSETDIARIAAPVGLNIGGRNPAEIALSIAAQVVEALRRPKDAL